MKATVLLSRQHRKLEQLFGRLERAPSDRGDVLRLLADALVLHFTIEEEIFYPTVRKKLNERGRDRVLESYEEHAVARFALERLIATGRSDETFHPKAKALWELVQDHIEDEEDDLFPLVERMFDDEALQALGKKIEQHLARGEPTGSRLQATGARGGAAPVRRHPRRSPRA